jgi:hypothetical protein
MVTRGTSYGQSSFGFVITFSTIAIGVEGRQQSAFFLNM